MRSVSFQTIMVAIDASEVSKKAFEKALTLAKALNIRLVIAHVLGYRDADSPQPPDSYINRDSIKLDQILYEKYEQEWNAYVDHYEALLKQRTQEAEEIGIEAEYVQVHGTPGASLCKMARTMEVDLLIVGSHQRRGISELLMGSTSNYIMHHAPCSVLVVHPSGRERTSISAAAAKETIPV